MSNKKKYQKNEWKHEYVLEKVWKKWFDCAIWCRKMPKRVIFIRIVYNILDISVKNGTASSAFAKWILNRDVVCLCSHASKRRCSSPSDIISDISPAKIIPNPPKLRRLQVLYQSGIANSIPPAHSPAMPLGASLWFSTQKNLTIAPWHSIIGL